MKSTGQPQFHRASPRAFKKLQKRFAKKQTKQTNTQNRTKQNN